eukprot:gnl/Trimastix_PCT/225.p1 GENE.gnl/Trimastix_PCT/225~~gnl/Trimastix_PCT/225.p1  ORF type:complete len:720 (-),score=308.34 gnl/Trimastix_PCT/225:309-2468(-)
MSELTPFFNPASVAVIGATDRVGVGRTLLLNLLRSPFGGVVYPINPKREQVLGVKAYPSVGECPTTVDLAIIATPARTVPALVLQCKEAGVRTCVILSAGFKEMGAPGIELERQLMANKGDMRIIGPNCLGIMSSSSGVNGTFASSMIKDGSIAFFSQSGALCTAVLDWSRKVDFGFSAFVSTGSMMDVDWADLIDHFGQDEKTKAMLIYMETIGDPARFMAAAQRVGSRKPIIVLKSGRSEAGAAAAASHTGSLAGSDEVVDAAFERAGVIRVNEIMEAFCLMELLSSQPAPQGPKLTIVTNAGGPGVLSADALADGDGVLAPISEAAMAQYNSFLPDAWSHGNPIDVLGDAPPERYSQSLEVAAQDENTDGVLVILTPQDMSDPTATAQALARHANIGKPVMASWMGGADVAEGVRVLQKAGIPCFEYPDSACRIFNILHKFHKTTEMVSEPTQANAAPGVDREAARAEVTAIMQPALTSGRTVLTEYESKKILNLYQINGGRTEMATSPDEAVAMANEIGYPVVIKIHSETITHKSDVGGVMLNIQDDEGTRRAYDTIKENVTKNAGAEHFLGVVVMPFVKLRDAYEVIIGANADPQFGPTMLFGLGGTLVEVFRDKSLGLPPLNRTFARRMLSQTKIFKALQGVRGQRPVDIEELENILLRFSMLIADNPWIKELDINPLLASPDGILALDARIIVYDGTKTNQADLPRTCVPTI